MREYGWECLIKAGEAEATQAAYAQYFLTLAEEAEPALHRAEQITWWTRLERDHENLRAVLRWSLELDERELALRLGGALWFFWNIHGHVREGRAFLEQALTGSASVAAAVRAKALRTAGWLAYIQGDFRSAERLCQEGLALFRDLGDAHYSADIPWMLGQTRWAQGTYAEAWAFAAEVRTLAEEAGDRHVLVYVLIMLGRIALFQGKYPSAQTLLEAGLALAREVKDTMHIANALGHLAKVSFFAQSDAATARALYEEALEGYRTVGAIWTIAYNQSELSHVVLAQGDVALARALVEESLVVLSEVGALRDIARARFFAANILAFQGDDAAARAEYEAGLKQLLQIGDQQYIAFCLERLG